MKKQTLFATIAIAAIFFSFTVVTNTEWTNDKAHTKVGFTITHLMISDVEGSFKNATIKLTSTKDDFTDAIVEFSAEAASINTDNEKRDAHLQSPDFFDVAKFPTLTFKSTSFKKASEANTYIVKGNLTMHGVTKSVTLNAVARTCVNPMSKKTIAGFKITGTVLRSDFGIGGSMPSAMISDEVQIIANAEFSKN
jgi:polyisoprenoid-binding protein YceI